MIQIMCNYDSFYLQIICEWLCSMYELWYVLNISLYKIETQIYVIIFVYILFLYLAIYGFSCH